MEKVKSNANNKSLITNLAALSLIVLSFYLPITFHRHVLNIGLFALSGALTNWLAIHMLFERVPFLYGSGVIPARFTEFKDGIFHLIMKQFFTSDNISRFFEKPNQEVLFNMDPIIQELDLNRAYDAMVRVVRESSFGNMLGMFGGEAALEPLREPFIEKMRRAIVEITSEPGFQKRVAERLRDGETDMDQHMLEKVELIVRKRLDELTPDMVKEIVQQMIRKHLGWLVVWGGVFGGLIGLLMSFVA